MIRTREQPAGGQVRRWQRLDDAVLRRLRTPSRVAVMTVAAMAATALIAMGELSRLVQSALAPTGDAGSLTQVIGPGAWGARGAWSVWAQATDDVTWWVAAHTLVDVAFYTGYGVLLLWFVRRSPVARRCVLGLLGFEVVETVLLLTSVGALSSGVVPTWLTALVAVTATLKWLTVALLLIAVLRTDALRRMAWQRARLLLRALKYQRLSAVPVVALGVLSTVPGPNIWDQLPDVERAWANDWQDALDGAFALASLAVVAFLLLVLGRHRSWRALRTRGGGSPPAQRARPWVWLIGPTVVLLVAIGLAALGPAGSVDWPLVAVFAALPVVGVVGSSFVIERRVRDLWSEADEPLPVDKDLVADVRRVGDGLALGLLVVAGVGLVRSFVAPVALADDQESRWGQLLLLLLGVGLAVGSFPWGARAIGRLDTAVSREDGRVRGAARDLVSPRAERTWIAAVAPYLWLGAAGLVVAMMLAPAPITGVLGVVATVMLALGAWVVLFGFLIVHLQDRQAMAVFRLLRMRAAPVLTMFVAVPVLATLLPSDPVLHHVRTAGAAREVTDRGTLEQTFQDWLARSSVCDREVDSALGPVTVRPLLVVGASGGGIRSAVWTSSVLTVLQESGGCGATVTLLSSGVSGGSVGLALSRQVATGERPLAAAVRLSAPDSLALGLAGTLVGDLVAGTTGVRLPTAVGGDDPARWVDRAGLMEREWEQTIPGLAQLWSPQVSGPGGALILNSTAVGLGCRVLVSQVDLGPPGPVAGPANCRSRSGLPAGSLDLFDTYAGCSPVLRWSTAAMLSARFPTVTPAGRIPRSPACADRPDLQLVDGGYAESSGLGTLAEIAPALNALVRDHNAAGSGPVVVPLVAYFEDEVRSDVTLAPPDQAPEALVPLAGLAAKQLQSISGSHLQRISAAFADPCPGEVPDRCHAATGAVRDVLPEGVALVAPSTRPAVSAPLGWTLSEDSRRRLLAALGEQTRLCAVPPGRYAGLGRLLDLLRPAGQAAC